MSDEPSKPIGQVQPEDNSGFLQPDETSPGTVEPGDSCVLPSAPPESEGAPDQALSDQLGSEADSQRCDPIPQIKQETANGREPSNPPPSPQEVQTQSTSGSDVRSEEPLDDDAESPIGSDSDLTEADRRALLSYEERLGSRNRSDLDREDDAESRLNDADQFTQTESANAGLSPVQDVEQHDGGDFYPGATHDLVRRGGRIHISVIAWSGSNPTVTTYDSEIRNTNTGRYYGVPQLPPAVYESMLLPTDAGGYRGVQEVVGNIFALLQHIPVLSERQRELLTYWCIATWFSDVLPSVPRLTITGPKYAADLLFRALRCVCRRPVLLAGINPAVLKSIPIGELMPTLFIFETSPSKRGSALLDASDQRGYLVAAGGQVLEPYCVKALYLGQESPKPAPEGIHIHLARHASLPGKPLPSDRIVQTLQNQLLSYRCFNLDRVRASEFKANDLLPELDVVARPLATAIVDDRFLQGRVVELLKELNEQARVDRSSGLQGVVVRAALFHCHESDPQQVFVRQIGATVKTIYKDEGESRTISNETIGHALKGLGLFSRRLGSGGRGLILDKSTQIKVHELSHAYGVLPEAPGCGYCHALQSPQSKEVV